MPGSRSSSIWRTASISLGILLAVCVVLDRSGVFRVPGQITLFITGALVAAGVGYSIVNPGASPVRLDAKQERNFLAQQISVSFVFSALLILLLTVKEVRSTPLAWLLLPIIVLPGFLWLSARAGKKRR